MATACSKQKQITATMCSPSQSCDVHICRFADFTHTFSVGSGFFMLLCICTPQCDIFMKFLKFIQFRHILDISGENYVSKLLSLAGRDRGSIRGRSGSIRGRSGSIRGRSGSIRGRSGVDQGRSGVDHARSGKRSAFCTILVNASACHQSDKTVCSITFFRIAAKNTMTNSIL